jgi:ferric-dicitrate binding protein FerR (iron transport regulator)
MTPDSQIDDEFLLRIMRWQDGTLTETELQQLEAEMLASEAKRQLFAEAQMRSLQLNELLRREAYAAKPEPAAKPKILRRFRWALGAAAAVVAAGGLIMALRPDKASAAPGLASVTYDQAAEWERGPVEGRLSAGSYSLTSGTVRLAMTHDGTIASLAAPATFDLIEPGHIRLHEGRLSAEVSDPDKGFTVLTDALTVLDRGTVFGVDVNKDGEAVVSVVEGMVDVHPPGSTAMQRIEQGGILRARPKGKPVLQAGAEPTRGFQDLWPLTLGVDDLSHLVEFVIPRAKHKWGDYRSDSRLFLMPERQRFVSDGTLAVNLLPAPGPGGPKPSKGPHLLAKGTKVRSYLLFFRPAEGGEPGPHTLSGSIAFARPVVGVIAGGELLMATDEKLGHPRVVYRDKPRRGIEHPKHRPEERDIVRISRDGRRLYFNLKSDTDTDEFRVLVAVP